MFNFFSIRVQKNLCQRLSRRKYFFWWFSLLSSLQFNPFFLTDFFLTLDDTHTPSLLFFTPFFLSPSLFLSLFLSRTSRLTRSHFSSHTESLLSWSTLWFFFLLLNDLLFSPNDSFSLSLSSQSLLFSSVFLSFSLVFFSFYEKKFSGFLLRDNKSSHSWNKPNTPFPCSFSSFFLVSFFFLLHFLVTELRKKQKIPVFFSLFLSLWESRLVTTRSKPTLILPLLNPSLLVLSLSNCFSLSFSVGSFFCHSLTLSLTHFSLFLPLFHNETCA